jgi:hypothetical protein
VPYTHHTAKRARTQSPQALAEKSGQFKTLDGQLTRSQFAARRFPGFVEPIECALLRVDADVRVVLQHATREMATDRFDNVIRFPGF